MSEDDFIHNSSAFTAEDLNGNTLKKGTRNDDHARSGELTAKSAADFDGAFLSFKLAFPGGGNDEDKEEEEEEEEEEVLSPPPASFAPGSTKDKQAAGGSEETRKKLEKAKKKTGGLKEKVDKAKEVAKTGSYFVLDAQITFLCFEVQLFISMKTGGPDSGIFAWFSFLWSVGNVELAYMSAEFIFTPFLFSVDAVKDAVSDVGGFVDSIHLFLGIAVRPTILNIIIDAIEPVLRVILGLILTPIVLVVFAAQQALKYLIRVRR